MGLEISKLDANMQSWAKKCDANGDGKINDAELDIFQQGKNTMHLVKNDNVMAVNIDGVLFFVDDIETIKKNDKGSKFDNTVKFKTGMVMEYDKQAPQDKALVFSQSENGVPVHAITDIFDGDGVNVKGTAADENFYIENTKIDSLDGAGGKNTLQEIYDNKMAPISRYFQGKPELTFDNYNFLDYSKLKNVSYKDYSEQIKEAKEEYQKEKAAEQK